MVQPSRIIKFSFEPNSRISEFLKNIKCRPGEISKQRIQLEGRDGPRTARNSKRPRRHPQKPSCVLNKKLTPAPSGVDDAATSVYEPIMRSQKNNNSVAFTNHMLPNAYPVVENCSDKVVVDLEDTHKFPALEQIDSLHYGLINRSFYQGEPIQSGPQLQPVFGNEDQYIQEAYDIVKKKGQEKIEKAKNSENKLKRARETLYHAQKKQKAHQDVFEKAQDTLRGLGIDFSSNEKLEKRLYECSEVLKRYDTAPNAGDSDPNVQNLRIGLNLHKDAISRYKEALKKCQKANIHLLSSQENVRSASHEKKLAQEQLDAYGKRIRGAAKSDD